MKHKELNKKLISCLKEALIFIENIEDQSLNEVIAKQQATISSLQEQNKILNQDVSDKDSEIVELQDFCNELKDNVRDAESQIKVLSEQVKSTRYDQDFSRPFMKYSSLFDRM